MSVKISIVNDAAHGVVGVKSLRISSFDEMRRTFIKYLRISEHRMFC